MCVVHTYITSILLYFRQLLSMPIDGYYNILRISTYHAHNGFSYIALYLSLLSHVTHHQFSTIRTRLIIKFTSPHCVHSNYSNSYTVHPSITSPLLHLHYMVFYHCLIFLMISQRPCAKHLTRVSCAHLNTLLLTSEYLQLWILTCSTQYLSAIIIFHSFKPITIMTLQILI